MKVDVWKKVVLGPLPVAAIARCLGLTLVEGDVVFYPVAQRHAFEKDPTRHPVCMPHLLDVVADPTHIGQQPKHAGTAFELVRVIQQGPIILVGISLMPLKKRGVYTVKSVYPITHDTLARRVRLGSTAVVPMMAQR